MRRPHDRGHEASASLLAADQAIGRFVATRLLVRLRRLISRSETGRLGSLNTAPRQDIFLVLGKHDFLLITRECIECLGT